MTKEQAIICLKQLTGRNNPLNVLKAMLGAKVAASDNGVAFTFKMCKKANVCRIALNGNDIYDVTFSRFRAFEEKEVQKFNDIFAEDLKGIFENFTGLRVSL